MSSESRRLLDHADAESLYSEDGAEGSLLMGDVSRRMTLSWENLCVEAPPAKKPLFKRKNYKPVTDPKPILQNSNGIVHPGSVLAVIGASGSGKTVLLNCMTRRNLGNLRVSGDIRVNGQRLGPAISKISAYVQQHASFIGTLKVREHLWFQAQLRLDSSFSEAERHRRVEEVMKELGLAKRSETLIGIPGKLKTLSGGERRRLLFASEILTNPYILFCDEPTTGLDSFMAQSVIQMLRSMASKGRTLICTIHQPASEVYAMFDQLALLADGRMAYMGPTKEVLPFFSSIGYPCPPNYNPADFFIHTLALVPGKEQGHHDTVRTICDAYNRSVYSEDVLDSIAACKELHSQDDEFFKALGGDDKESYKGYNRSKWVQFKCLFWRSWLQQARDPVAFKSSLFQFVVVGMFVGLIYLQQNYDQKGVQNIDGALFMMQMMITFNTMFAVLSILPGEYPLFQREYQDRMYSVDMYYLSHLLTEWPVYVFFLPALFLAIVYWMIGLYPSLIAYLQTNVVIFMIAMYAIAFAHLVSVFTCSVTLSLSILPLIRNILTIFGGYFININSVPWILYPLQYLSAFVYSNEILVVNQWQNVDAIHCEYEDMDNASSGARCLTDGFQVISDINFSESNVKYDYIYLFSLYLIAEIVGLTVLYLRAKKLRRD